MLHGFRKASRFNPFPRYSTIFFLTKEKNHGGVDAPKMASASTPLVERNQVNFSQHLLPRVRSPLPNRTSSSHSRGAHVQVLGRWGKAFVALEDEAAVVAEGLV